MKLRLPVMKKVTTLKGRTILRKQPLAANLAQRIASRSSKKPTLPPIRPYTKPETVRLLL